VLEVAFKTEEKQLKLLRTHTTACPSPVLISRLYHNPDTGSIIVQRIDGSVFRYKRGI
jgi:hypothetical protein